MRQCIDPPQEDGFYESGDKTLHGGQGETPQPGASHVGCELVDARAENMALEYERTPKQ